MLIYLSILTQHPLNEDAKAKKMLTSDEKLTSKNMFDGLDKSYPYWEQKFIARALKLKFHKVLLGSEIIPKKEVDYNDVSMKATADMTLILDQNIEAYCELVSAINTNLPTGWMAFNLILNSRTQEYPNGNAATAFASLRNKY